MPVEPSLITLASTLLASETAPSAPASPMLMRGSQRMFARLQSRSIGQSALVAQPHVPFFVLDAPSPMSVPVLARGARMMDRVAPDDLDGALARAAHELWLRSGAVELP